MRPICPMPDSETTSTEKSIMLHTPDTAHWRALVTAAEASVKSCLEDELESYLVMVLVRHAGTTKPWAPRGKIESAHGDEPESIEVLREVGDRCLVIAGLLAEEAADIGVPVSYFVDTGRRAYRELAGRTRNPLFNRLSDRFVAIMDVLQIMRTLDERELAVDLFSAYDQWQDTGSQHAFRLLRAATGALPSPLLSHRRH